MEKREPWGKFSDGEYHHLAHHCADVSACFEAILASPVVLSRFEKCARMSLSKVQISRLAALAFLHDCGKLHPGFQAKGWQGEGWTGGFHGHLAEGAAIFKEKDLHPLALNLNLENLSDWGVDWDWLFASFAHHGRPFRPSIRAKKGWRVALSVYDPATASEELGGMMRRWFPNAFDGSNEDWPDTADAQHFFCGLVSLADWIGSSRKIFEFAPDLDPEYATKARRLARQAIADIGLDVNEWRAAAQGRTEFETLTDGLPPRPQQRLVGDFPLDDPLLILEAETGSGKTESALWRFIQLFAEQYVDSLYFALPTRAAALQIHCRVNDAMKHVFGEEAPDAVLAVPGYLKAGETEGHKLPKWEVKWDDDDGVSERKLLARWAAENSKRTLAAPVAVGTVDQAMFAALQVKHAHLRAGALARSLLVIDEVHASDHYMTELQAHLLRMHLDRGGHAMLMSATLGTVARSKWLERQIPAFSEAVKTPYPAVWGKNSSNPRHISQKRTEKKVAMKLIETMASRTVSSYCIDAAKRGARVLVIRNTVKDAIDVFRAVKSSEAKNLLLQVNGGPALHHGRFAPEDRALLDKGVEASLCPKRAGDTGCIVIGTQTLEQSLDIDADLLLTDLCPVDVLLQRIGRLHRRTRSRPAGFEKPECCVFSLDEGLETLLAPCFKNGLGAWKTRHGLEGIYRDVSGLELTRRLVEKYRIWEIPKMNRFLVESATNPEAIELLHKELGKAWSDYSSAVYGKDIADAGAARTVALPTALNFTELQFPENDEAIRTRLGSEGARLTFEEGVVGPFGTIVSGLTMPGHWQLGEAPTEPLCPTSENGSLHLSVAEIAFSYCREGFQMK